MVPLLFLPGILRLILRPCREEGEEREEGQEGQEGREKETQEVDGPEEPG